MSQLKLSPWKEKLALAAGALLAMTVSLGGVAALFAGASGELEQVVAWLWEPPAEQAMAGDPPRKPGA